MTERNLVVRHAAVPPDRALSADRGWIDMEVRWLVTAESVGSEQTVIGRTVLQPGSRHELHRHPNAEEWEYVVAGAAVKRIGDRLVRLEAGDVVFVPKGEYHSLENASAPEPVVTIWGYSGAATLEQAGYLLPSDEPA